MRFGSRVSLSVVTLADGETVHHARDSKTCSAASEAADETTLRHRDRFLNTNGGIVGIDIEHTLEAVDPRQAQ
ncbi:MAG: hypothetical protein ABSA57_05485 [Candidatus Acidiferrales bacterium]